MAQDGHTYERVAIVEWLKTKGTSPTTQYLMADVQEAETLLMEALQASRQAFGAAHTQTARVRQELDAVRAARRGDEVDGSKLERGPIVLDKPEGNNKKTIDSID